MSVILRPVQSEWISQISWKFRHARRVLGVACTGFGKTVCFVEIARRTIERGHSVMIIAHRIEIVNQIAAALQRARVPFGWVAPGRETGEQPVLVGMVQTVANRLHTLKQPKLLVIDEAHNATAGVYRKISDAWEDCYSLGVTASPLRTDGTGLGACFDEMVVGPAMSELISRGYLANFTYLAPERKVDLDSIRIRAGDYAQDELAAAMDRSAITGDAIGHYAKHLNGKPAIAFCVSVEHSRHVAEQFAQAGWRASSVDGATDPKLRADSIAAIGDGRLNVLTSCDIISEGTDIPAVSGAMLLRPSMSLIVYLQQCGRVLRPKGDGSRAIILDHVGNVLRFGLPDEPREWSLQGRSKAERPPAVRQCPGCYAAHRPAPKCPCCGNVYADTAAPRRGLQQRDGELEEMNAERVRLMREADLKTLLKAARTREAVDEIRKARGYSPAWTQMQMRLREKYRSRFTPGARESAPRTRESGRAA